MYRRSLFGDNQDGEPVSQLRAWEKQGMLRSFKTTKEVEKIRYQLAFFVLRVAFFSHHTSHMGGHTPLDRALYARTKSDAKKRFKRWPSAYGSAWLTREYQRRGGKYSSDQKRSAGVHRWMREEWVQVGPALDGHYIPCGSSNRDGKACRPRWRKSPKTPPTLSEVVRRHGKSKVRKLASKKSQDMNGRVDWRRGHFNSKSR